MPQLRVRTAFFTFDVGVTAILGRGGKTCRKGTRKMDKAYEEAERRDPTPQSVGSAGEMRTLLRARCGICPRRCRDPL